MNPAHLLQVSGTDFLFSSSSHLRPSEIWKYRTGTDLFTFWTTCFDIFFVTLQQTEHVPLRQVYAVTLLTNQKEVFFSFWHHEMTTERPGVRVDPPCSLEVVGVCPVYLNSYSTSYYWLIIPLLKSWKCLSSITLNKFTRLLHFFSTPLTSKRLAAYRWSFVTVCFNNLWTVKKKKRIQVIFHVWVGDETLDLKSMMGGNTYFACSLPMSVVPSTYSENCCHLVWCSACPQCWLAKVFLLRVWITGGFVMFFAL